MLLKMSSDLGYLRHGVDVVIFPTTELRPVSICSYFLPTLVPTPSLFIAENAWQSVWISSAACRKDMARALLPGRIQQASAKQYLPCLSIKLIGWLSRSYKHDIGTVPKRSSTIVILGGSLETVGTEAGCEGSSLGGRPESVYKTRDDHRSQSTDSTNSTPCSLSLSPSPPWRAQHARHGSLNSRLASPRRTTSRYDKTRARGPGPF
jgi:hypothetical protein